VLADLGHRFGGLLSNDGLVNFAESLQKVEKHGFVLEKGEHLAELLSDGEKNFIVFLIDKA
jgi:hypothetical protein